MTKFLLPLLLLVPSWAFAQDAALSTSNSLTGAQPAQAHAAFDAVHKCPRLVPPSGSFMIDGVPAGYILVTASRASLPAATIPAPPKDNSVTELAVHVLQDGMVKSVSTLASSGNADLDGTASTCLVGARLPPIMSDGHSIEADTTVTVGWPSGSIAVLSETPPELPESFTSEALYYPRLAIQMHRQGYAVLSFTIAADGKVKNIRLIKSAGFDALDHASIGSLSRRRFQCAVTQNGKPVDNDTKMAFIWRML